MITSAVVGVSLVAVLISSWSVLRSDDSLRRVLRRERIHAESFTRYADAVTRGSFDDAAKALARHSQNMLAELESDEAHPFRPWRSVPRVGEPWPVPPLEDEV